MAEKREVDRRTYAEFASLVYGSNLRALLDAIDKCGYGERRLSVLAPKDESLCMDFRDSHWSVFSVERGRDIDEESFADINDACHRLLSRLATSKKDALKLRRTYDSFVTKYSMSPLQSKVFASSVRDIISKVVTH